MDQIHGRLHFLLSYLMMVSVAKSPHCLHGCCKVVSALCNDPKKVISGFLLLRLTFFIQLEISQVCLVHFASSSPGAHLDCLCDNLGAFWHHKWQHIKSVCSWLSAFPWAKGKKTQTSTYNSTHIPPPYWGCKRAQRRVQQKPTRWLGLFFNKEPRGTTSLKFPYAWLERERPMQGNLYLHFLIWLHSFTCKGPERWPGFFFKNHSHE